jgi:hypothetical protein
MELCAPVQESGGALVKLDGKRVSIGEFEVVLQGTSLFGDDRIVLLEELMSAPQSKRRTQLLQMAKESIDDPAAPPVIFWEKKTLTKTQLSPFAGFQIENFSLPKVVYGWTECIGSPDTDEVMRRCSAAIAAEGAERCLALLAWHLQLLLASMAGAPIKAAPFQRNILARQQRHFTLPILTKLIASVVRYDVDRKSGKVVPPLDAQLLLWSLPQKTRLAKKSEDRYSAD